MFRFGHKFSFSCDQNDRLAKIYQKGTSYFFTAKANGMIEVDLKTACAFRVNGVQAGSSEEFDATFHPEGTARTFNKKPISESHSIALLRLANIIFILSFCIGPPNGWANTTSLKLNTLLYCPSTHYAIMCIYPPSLDRNTCLKSVYELCTLRHQLYCTQCEY